MVATLPITYTGPDPAAPLDLLKLEQKDWSVYTGVVTKQELVRWLSATLTGEEYQSRIDCGIAGDNLVCTIYAYPFVEGLAYRLYTSWGTLSERVVEQIEISELVQFRLTDTERLQYPARRIRESSWADDCYGPDGEVIAAPELAVAGETVSSATPVYGTAEVKYLTERHTYILNAPRREDAIDNNFSSVVVGTYDGGLTWLVPEMPPGIAAFEADPDAICGWRYLLRHNPPSDPLPTPQPADRRTVIDYCSGQLVSDGYI